jgi:hypothetical protein
MTQRLSIGNRSSDSDDHQPRGQVNGLIREDPVIDDYANLQGDSLLKKTLGYA